MAILKISINARDVKTSSITTDGVVDGDGWNRDVNYKDDRLTGCDAGTSANVNWRTFVRIPKSKLASVADKKINSVRLIVQPKVNNACSIPCTQAILTNKTLSVLAEKGIELLDNTWCAQGSINNRYGDIGLSNTGKTYLKDYYTSRPYTIPSGNAEPSIVTTTWSAGETIPKMQYIFNNVSNIKFDQDVGFYIIRYKPSNYTSGMGKSGWLYTTTASWTVEIDYDPSYDVTVNVKVNNHYAGNNFMLALSKTDGIAIGIDDGTTRKFPTTNSGTISVPANSRITLIHQSDQTVKPWIRVSAGSTFNTGSDVTVNKAITINVSFDLKVEVTFLSNKKGLNPDKSSSLNLFYDQFQKYYGERIYLPITPGIKYDDRYPPVSHRSPDMFFSDASFWDYIDGVAVHVDNVSGNSISVPDLYDDDDFVFGKKYVPDFLVTGETIAREYTLENELEIMLAGRDPIPWNKDQEQSRYVATYSVDSDPLSDIKSNNDKIFKGISKLSYFVDNTEVVGWDTILDEVYINNKEAELAGNELSYNATIKTDIEPIIKFRYKNNNGTPECLLYEHVRDELTLENVDIPLFPVLIE